jgi:SOS response associated peptidase (SRAP)
VARRGLFRGSRNLLSHKRQDWLSGAGPEGKGFGPVVTSAVHNRMPVILNPDTYDLWLDPGMTNVAAASELLRPYDARLMRCYPVSTRINHVSNDDAECSRPVELAEIQARLFW